MNIHCAGIGGIGLSAYAAYQRSCGHHISGSDRSDSALLADLRSQGIDISLSQDGSAVSSDTDLFVYTLALPESNPERRRATALGITQQTYFEALGELTNGTHLIAVSGTHGKSSTTAMAAKVLIDAAHDPSVILGTKTADLNNRNWRKGAGDVFLVEACEYRRSFLNLSPKIILLTNVTGDHFDAYRDIDDYRDAFRTFIGKLPSNGVLIAHGSDPACVALAHTAPCHFIDADLFPLPNLAVPGAHMQKNAQLVLALADFLDIPNDIRNPRPTGSAGRANTGAITSLLLPQEGGAEQSLVKYRGCWRRSEVRGETSHGALVIDDYGHHPNEIRATLEGLRAAYRGRRLVCVFQPHTHDRVLKLYNEFLTAFAAADIVIIPNIYEARSDCDSAKADKGKLMADISRVSHVEVVDGISLAETVAMLNTRLLQKNDLLVTMGAGDVTTIADKLIA